MREMKCLLTFGRKASWESHYGRLKRRLEDCIKVDLGEEVLLGYKLDGSGSESCSVVVLIL